MMRTNQIIIALGFELHVTAGHALLFEGFAAKPELLPWAQIPHDATFSVNAEFPGVRVATIAHHVPGCRGQEVGDWLLKLWQHHNNFTAREDHVGSLLCRTWHE